MAHVKKADQPLVDAILKSLETNNKAVCRAIKLIGDMQTAEEMNQQATLEHNGVGFSGADAEFGTWLYRQICANIPLSKKSMDGARRIAKKYARTQLLALAKAKQALKETK